MPLKQPYSGARPGTNGASASHSQPSSIAEPPTGVTAPNQRGLPSARLLSVPAKIRLPISNAHAPPRTAGVSRQPSRAKTAMAWGSWNWTPVCSQPRAWGSATPWTAAAPTAMAVTALNAARLGSQRGDDDAHDLVGPLEDLVDAEVTEQALDGVIHQIAVAAVELKGAIDDRHAGVGRQPLGHRGELGLGRRAGLDLRGGGVEQRARRLQLGLHVGELELRRLEVADRLAELGPAAGIGDRLVQGSLRAAEAARADVEAPAVQALHGDGETLALVADAVGDRHAHCVEVDLRGRLAVPAQFTLRGAEADAGHVAVDDEAADALRPVDAGADHGDVDVVRAAAGDESL